MTEPYNIRWGVLATGGIAQKFTSDLLIDSSLRGASDISHTITAVASSSSKARAEEFISNINIPPPCAAYGSYTELVKDPNVDIIYVATPHSHHFQHTMLALEHGKNVLCEKPITVNAAQARILAEIAKQKKLFLMEAVWTRFFPICVQIRDLVRNGEIGDVLRVTADTSGGNNSGKGWDVKSRMVNLDLAGGGLLDLGIYSLTWVFQILYHTLPPSERKRPTSISAQMAKFPATGADESTSIILEFPRAPPNGILRAHGVALTSITLENDPVGNHSGGASVRVQGTKGEIQVFGEPYHPDKYKVLPRKFDVNQDLEVKEVVAEFPGNGKGMYWEADECARCLRDGKLESSIMPLDESLVIMEVMDEARRQGGLKYPEKIESTQYPLQL
ncbi:hypothetical protein FQN57_005577 [Myotisia sp. PD_48]|nr:hypothetical protein FQN57_005577 [Myotisia sp. PD_48]